MTALDQNNDSKSDLAWLRMNPHSSHLTTLTMHSIPAKLEIQQQKCLSNYDTNVDECALCIPAKAARFPTQRWHKIRESLNGLFKWIRHLTWCPDCLLLGEGVCVDMLMGTVYWIQPQATFLNWPFKQLINQSNFYSADIPSKLGSVAQQPNQRSTAKSRKHQHAR